MSERNYCIFNQRKDHLVNKFKTYHLIGISLVFLLLNLSSCREGLSSKGIDEGVIEFEISYPNPPEDKYVERMLPSTMNFKFKEGLTKSEVSISMGMIKMFYISDARKKEMTELVKFMPNKYSYTMDQNGVQNEISKLPNHRVELVEGTKIIAGYTCKKATVYIDGENPRSFDVYYTNEIDIPDANWYNPYKEIEGVLLEYEIERFNVLMHLTASKVEPANFEEGEFTSPEEYDVVDKSEMEKMHDMFKELNQ